MDNKYPRLPEKLQKVRKLTTEDKLRIKELASHMTLGELAIEYKVHPTTIWYTLNDEARKRNHQLKTIRRRVRKQQDPDYVAALKEADRVYKKYRKSIMTEDWKKWENEKQRNYYKKHKS